jgi:hypothetical protein
MKKKIAIMFVGQIRTNGLSGTDNEEPNKILVSIDKYLLNNNFKHFYDYDIFISTDKICIEKAKSYFGENLKNINITEDNWFYNSLKNENEIKNYDFFYNQYLDRVINYKEYNSYTGCFYQNYRIYCAYNMILDYEQKTNIDYYYYIKIRMDSVLMQDFNQLMMFIEMNNKKICMEHDHLIIVNNEYKHIFNFINFIGIYQYKIDNSDGIFNYFFRNSSSSEINSNDAVFFFCPERQIIEYIRYLANINKDMTKDIFLGITYPSFHLIYRGNNNYGYSDHTDDKIFVPYHNHGILNLK